MRAALALSSQQLKDAGVQDAVSGSGRGKRKGAGTKRPLDAAETPSAAEAAERSLSAAAASAAESAADHASAAVAAALSGGSGCRGSRVRKKTDMYTPVDPDATDSEGDDDGGGGGGVGGGVGGDEGPDPKSAKKNAAGTPKAGTPKAGATPKAGGGSGAKGSAGKGKGSAKKTPGKGQPNTGPFVEETISFKFKEGWVTGTIMNAQKDFWYKVKFMDGDTRTLQLNEQRRLEGQWKYSGKRKSVEQGDATPTTPGATQNGQGGKRSVGNHHSGRQQTPPGSANPCAV